MSARYDAAMERLDAVLNAPSKRTAPTKQYLRVKAATLAMTDQGSFSAVISAEHPDRERDVLPTGAMLKAIRAWIPSGKMIPLAWNHSGKAEDLVGHIDPNTARAADGEVAADGWIDQSTPRGAEAWRLVKSRTLGFSFGYLIVKSTKRSDGVRVLDEIDLFEVSATSTPMQGRTRVLGWKAAQTEAPSLEDLAEREARLFEDPATTQLHHEAYNDMLAQLRGNR